MLSKHAYADWSGVVVVEGAPSTGDHQAVVQTNSAGQGDSCGSTDINVPVPVDGEVCYECNMREAQIALQVQINNAQDEANALKRPEVVQAIGRGIGNNAAHEIAHQFLVKCCGMDVLISSDPSAAGTYNNGDADADPNPLITNSDPAPYTGIADYVGLYGETRKCSWTVWNTCEQLRRAFWMRWKHDPSN